MIAVIPLYKQINNLESYEILSIRNTIHKIGNNYPVCIVGPERINYDDYCRFFNFKFLRIIMPSDYFNNIHTYNNLMKSKLFYEKFNDNSHILLVQTDVYVFNNEIEKYFQYDYIGAPWHFNILNPVQKGLFGGNGGFSLRNVQACLEVLSSNKKMFTFDELKELINTSEFHVKASIIKKYADTIGYYLTQNKFSSGKNRLPFIYEDVFWSLLVPNHFPNFKVAPGNIAVKFSFETEPELCFKLNNNQLPLGCHGFQRYNTSFWKKYIAELNDNS